MRSCFLPNCDAHSKGWTTRPMFSAPKNAEMLAKWKEVLPKKREFKASDKVCVRHFEDYDFVTTYDTIIKGGIVQIPRGRPKLNPNAVPAKYLNDCDYPKRGRKIGSKSICQNEISMKKIILKKVKIKKNNLNKCEQKCDSQTENSMKELIYEEETSNNINPNTEELPNITESKEDNVNIQIFAQYKGKINRNENDDITEREKLKKKLSESKKESKKQQEIFNSLYEDIFEIELPSTLWGIHRDPSYKFIVLTYFDSKLLVTSKTIIINNNLKADITIFHKNFANSDAEYCSIQDITDMLHEVDNFRLCSLADQSNFLCELKLDDDDDEFCKCCLHHQLLQQEIT